MSFLRILELFSAVLVFVTGACYCYQVLYLLVPLVRKSHLPQTAQKKRYAILIAARNEEAVLPHLLDSIRNQDYPAQYLTTYVIADNCTDCTAAVAAQRGARVYQRFNTAQVGKGYALNYLLEQIRLSGEMEQYDCFLVFDADNLLRPDYISQMNRLCAEGYEAFCGYRNSKNYGSNWLSSGYALWYLHESAHLNRSRMALGTCCAVSGTGFGFTRQLLERTGGWNFFTLTEDIEFGTWCATRGVRIGYCHDAIAYDEQPTDFAVSVRQRTRWIQGGIQVSVRYARDFLRGLSHGGKTAWASFEMATLSLWGYGMSAVSFAFTLLVTFLAEGWMGLVWTLVVALGSGYLSLFAIGALTLMGEWNRIYATRDEKMRSLFTFPFFMLSYLPIVVLALFRKYEWMPIGHSVAISVAQLRESWK